MAEGPDFYDAAIKERSFTLDNDGELTSPHLLDPLEGPYAELFETVAAMIKQRRPTHLVDLGCGTGRFASLVLPHTGLTLSYVGVDFSPGMLAEARSYNHEHVTPEDDLDPHDLTGVATFVQLDMATDHCAGVPLTWVTPLTIVCLETLEHLDNDLRLLARLPLEARLIVSVPSFDSAAHVRHFPNPGDALDRYQDVMELDTWKTVWLPERTGYFHLITGRVRP